MCRMMNVNFPRQSLSLISLNGDKDSLEVCGEDCIIRSVNLLLLK